MENLFLWEIIYKISSYDNTVKIFGKKFVENNIDKCKIIFKEKECQLNDYVQINNKNNKEELKIKLKPIGKISDMSYMFDLCVNLLKIVDNPIDILEEGSIDSKDKFLEYNNRIDLLDNLQINDFNKNNDIYKGNNMNLSSIPSILNEKDSEFINSKSNKNTEKDLLLLPLSINIIDMTNMFNGCKSLISLPDISKWNTTNVKSMSCLFNGCKSLQSLPDISKWDTSNVENMGSMFRECQTLKLFPDISGWNTSRVKDMSYMFNKCNSLISLPDLSK